VLTSQPVYNAPINTRKSSPANVAPIRSGWPVTLPARIPIAPPIESAASHTAGIDMHANRNSASTVAESVTSITTRPVKPVWIKDTAAKTTTTARTLMTGRFEAVMTIPTTAPAITTPQRTNASCREDAGQRGHPAQIATVIAIQVSACRKE